MTSITIYLEGLGLSHGDFFRIIPRLFPDATLQLLNNGAEIEWSDGRMVKIVLSEEKVRKLGLLKFPMTDVHFSFHECSQEFLDEFMVVFDRGFQKGGG
ncbi:MAG: hypothetical protein ACJZ79_01175 [Pseudohongiellaceae bacterium]|tara:strand:- start:402 stop:698 length:297 start_codon:yes stop_codon:yes gene_type:complete